MNLMKAMPKCLNPPLEAAVKKCQLMYQVGFLAMRCCGLGKTLESLRVNGMIVSGPHLSFEIFLSWKNIFACHSDLMYLCCLFFQELWTLNTLKNKLRGSLVEGKYLFTGANRGGVPRLEGSQGVGTGKTAATATHFISLKWLWCSSEWGPFGSKTRAKEQGFFSQKLWRALVWVKAKVQD